MDADVLAWLLAQLGTASDTNDLLARYTRLGTARAVAIEIVQERLAALRAQPASLSVSSVVSVSYAENIKAYERQLAALEAGEPAAPDDPPGTVTDDTIGLAFLIERPRR